MHHCDIRQWKMQDLDCVFSNPPYMVKEGIASPNDGRQIARHEMNGTLSDFCASAARVLRYGGMFFCVCRPDRMTDLLCGMRHSALEPKRMILVSQSVRHAPSLFLCEAKKGAKPALQLPPVLFLYDQNGDMTDAYRYITEHGEFPV